MWARRVVGCISFAARQLEVGRDRLVELRQNHSRACKVKEAIACLCMCNAAGKWKSRAARIEAVRFIVVINTVNLVTGRLEGDKTGVLDRVDHTERYIERCVQWRRICGQAGVEGVPEESSHRLL